MANKQHQLWLRTLKTRDEARQMVRESAFALLFLAAVYVIFSFMQGWVLLLQAGILSTGALAVLFRGSRIAAALILLTAFVGAGLAVANNSGMAVPGGKNLALGLIALWTAWKSVESTFRLQGRFAFAGSADTPQQASHPNA